MSKKGKKENRLFNKIAPVYGLFYSRQKKRFGAVLRSQTAVDFSAYKTVLDVGCGTGALCDVLSEAGLSVTGLDAAQKMLGIAKAKNRDSQIRFVQGSALLLPFKDNSFDICFASYVAHGMSWGERKTMYAQMSRVAKHKLIIYDYNANRSALTSLIEWAEHGDYFNFIKRATTELREQFSDVVVVNVDKRAAWYICAAEN